MEVRKSREWKESGNEDRFMAMKGGKGYTIADIEALPEGERAELIDGEMFRMDAPMTVHQRLLMELAFEIKLYIRNRKGKCEVLPAPYGVYIKKDRRNFVEPDISIICDKGKIDAKGCQGAPDWIIEIVSPSSEKMDYERKVELYRESGVREYWIADAERQTVTVYDFEHEKEAVRYAFIERIKAGIFDDLYLNLSGMDI